MFNRFRQAGLVLCLVAVTGCTAQYRNHGYVPSDEDLNNIIVGVDTRDTVAETVGPPSTSDMMDESGFYYVETRIKRFAYQEPEIVDRSVVAITFDSAGVVRNIETFGLEAGRVVPLSKRVTEPVGETNNFLKRLLSVLGRFDPQSALGG